MEQDWCPLEEALKKRGVKRFGRRAYRVATALPESIRSTTWLLDKKAFRKAVNGALPPGHDPITVSAEPLKRPRAMNAARAYERLRLATAHVPPLPEEIRRQTVEGAPENELVYFVWSSAVLKPRELTLVELEDCTQVDDSHIVDSICALWAIAYFDGVLDSIPSKTAKLDVAIGLTVCPSAAKDEVRRLVERQHQVARLFPLCSLAPRGVPDLTFDQGLFRRLYRLHPKQWRRLTDSSRKRFTEVLWGRPGILPEAVEELLDGASGPIERYVLQDLLGDRSPPRTEPLGWSPRRWWNAAREAASEIASQEELQERVREYERLVQERYDWMREMDLALLPDDGLRRSLEEVYSVLRLASGLSAETSVVAALQCRLYSALTGLPVTRVDLGLETPILEALQRFEEALEVVRADGSAARALAAGEQVPSGPARRALTEWSMRHPELLPFEEDRGGPSPLVEKAARDGLENKADIGLLTQTARVELDRLVANKESELPRPIASSLAPLRSRARQVVCLRERARMCEVKLDYLLRRIVLDIDRRLLRLDVGLKKGSAFHCTMEELVDAVDLRGTSLRARVAWRRAEQKWSAAHPSPFADPDATARSSTVDVREQDELPVGSTTLAVARRIPYALVLPYRGKAPRATGRASDTLPTTARGLGIEESD